MNGFLRAAIPRAASHLERSTLSLTLGGVPTHLFKVILAVDEEERTSGGSGGGGAQQQQALSAFVLPNAPLRGILTWTSLWCRSPMSRHARVCASSRNLEKNGTRCAAVRRRRGRRAIMRCGCHG